MDPITEEKINEQNPWERYATLNKAPVGAQVLAAALFGLASLAIPVGFLWEAAAYLFAPALLIGCGFLLRRFRLQFWTITILSVLSCSLPGLLIPSTSPYSVIPGLGSLMAALTVGLFAGSFFQTVTRRFWLLGLLSVAAGGITYLVSGSIWLSLLSLSLLPAVLLLSIATNMGEYCTTAVCYAAAGIFLSAVVVGVVAYWRCGQPFTADALRSLLDSWQETLTRMQITSRDEVIAMMEELAQSGGGQMSSSATQLTDTLQSTMSDEMLRASIGQIFSLLPAAFLLSCLLPAYLAQRMLNTAYAANGMREVVTPESEFFTMSLPAAILFVLSAVLMLLTPADAGLFSFAVTNLTILLLPGFFLLGIRSLKTRYAQPNAGRVLVILLLILFCCMSFNALLILAMLGAYDRVFSEIRRAIAKRQMNRDGQ